MVEKTHTEINVRSSAAEYLTFVSMVGDQPSSVELRYEDENIWLTQRLMSELYGVELSTINEHIKKIYADRELSEEATIRNFRIVQTEGSHQKMQGRFRLKLPRQRLKLNSRNSVSFKTSSMLATLTDS